MKRFALLLVSCFAALPLHAGVLGDAMTAASLAKCLLKQTQMICVAKQLKSDADVPPLASDTELLGRSGRFVLTPSVDGWVNAPPEKGEDEMLLFHPTGEAMLYAWWYEGKQDIYQEIAMRPYETALERGVEPDRQNLETWPFEEDGDFQLLCYETNKGTDECILSAAANMPHGTVHLLAFLHDEGTIFDEVVQLMLSIDTPPEPQASADAR